MTDAVETDRPTRLAATPMMGAATFLMTDIAGSTRLWEQESEAMPAALAAHDAILRGAVERFGGTVVKTTGDGILARFDESSDAVAAAVESQHALAARSDLAHALRQAGVFDAAETIYRETIQGWERFGNRGAIAHQLESFAYLALERGDAPRTAELLAAADGLREASGAGMLAFERAEHDAAQARIETLLDLAVLEAARRRGRQLSAEQAVGRAIGT